MQYLYLFLFVHIDLVIHLHNVLKKEAIDNNADFLQRRNYIPKNDVLLWKCLEFFYFHGRSSLSFMFTIHWYLK